MDLTSLLQSQLSEGMIDQLSQQLGGASKEQTQTAAAGIMNVLMGAMARNAATPQGAQALNNALERDHDGSVLDNVMDLLGGGGSRSVSNVNERALNGSGILNHILGSRQSGAVDMISQMSGLNQNQTGSLMATLAPIVMGMLGKAKSENNLDAGGVAGILEGFTRQQQGSNPAMGIISGFLDQDGDGSIVDDVANIGMKMLGGLFKKRR
ncbi:MAG: DUF937 domain-containing protein [Lewinella sp.]|nr:DUF937 domain-containing protein [Lewinella sp.]